MKPAPSFSVVDMKKSSCFFFRFWRYLPTFSCLIYRRSLSPFYLSEKERKLPMTFLLTTVLFLTIASVHMFRMLPICGFDARRVELRRACYLKNHISCSSEQKLEILLCTSSTKKNKVMMISLERFR